MCRKLLALALWVQCAGAYAQTIEVPDPYVMGTPLVVKVTDLPEGSRLLWENDPRVSLLPVDQNMYHGWVARVGEYPLAVYAAPPEGDLRKATATLRAVDSDNPGPNPEPKTLRELAGADAPALSAAYAVLLADVQLGSYKDVPTFKGVHDRFLAHLKLDKTKAAPELNKRLNVKTLEELKAALAKIIEELGKPPGPDPPDPTNPATAAVYVYEKDDGGVPSAVGAALSELNTILFRATTFEEDTTDSTGEVPEQYRVALIAAREAGLPALVVTAGDKVLRVVKNPKSKEEVIEATK